MSNEGHGHEWMREYHQCAAKNCTRRATGFSRYCATHRGRLSRTRDANGRILRKGRDLGEFRKMADAYLARYKDHPAIVQACQYLDGLLVQGSTYTGVMRVQRDIARELRRLRMDGADGFAMLHRLVAVAAFAHWNRRTFDDGPCYVVNLGHHLLRTVGRPGDGKVKSKVEYELGREVRETLGLLLSQVAAAIEREVTKQARVREGIAQAIQAEPLA